MTESVSLTVDGLPVEVPKGTLVIRAAEQVGVAIPRFCDHPLLDPVGACRQCIVEVEGERKPVASCTVEVREGMVVKTHLTSAVAEKAQAGTMELLLINHPLDCPMCDKGGECPLQNQAMSHGAAESRFHEPKRTYEKPIPISTEVLLDRERCVLCARCTRFSQQIAGDAFIELYERGALEQVGIDPSEPFHSYFSGNTVQICPVGALTSAAYRFRSRPFDLVSTQTSCEHCASGCTLRVDHRVGKVTRRQAADDPEVNEEWSCDKGRWAFHNGTRPDRLTSPLVRDARGAQVAASWTGALQTAGALIAQGTHAAVVAGGRLTAEDAYALAKLARGVLGTDDVDFRARPHSAEERDFLASTVVTREGTTYAQLAAAPQVVLVALEPEDESPILFLRLRKAVRQGQRVVAVTPLGSRGLAKLDATLAASLADVELEPGAVVLVGERAAVTPGLLSDVVSRCQAAGARLAWVPRRAGDRGALEAGLLPGVLPGGRPLTDAAARAEVAEVWGVPAEALPTAPGRSLDEVLAAARAGEVDTLLVAGLDPADLTDPEGAREAFAAVRTLVVLDVRSSWLTEQADVVLPVAPAAEREGHYVDWEGRLRPLHRVLGTNAVADLRVAHLLAAELGVDLGTPDAATTMAEMQRLGPWTGERPAMATVSGTPAGTISGTAAHGTVLETWRQLLDDGRLSDGEPHLAGTARPAVARMTEATAAGAHEVVVTLPGGSVALPVEVVPGTDGVVWLPMRGTAADGTRVDVLALGGAPGTPVTVRPWDVAKDGPAHVASTPPDPTPEHATTSASQQESKIEPESYGEVAQ